LNKTTKRKSIIIEVSQEKAKNNVVLPLRRFLSERSIVHPSLEIHAYVVWQKIS